MDVSTQIREIFAKWDKANAPGCALAVLKERKIIFQQGFGLANLDYDIPISSQTVFRIASVSKQFTAACIVLLAEQGLLSLDDDIRKYISELPEFKSIVTIRHLIHHTSGIRDYLDLYSLRGTTDQEFDSVNTDNVLELIKNQKKLNFPPGEQFLYSNTGYLFLAMIIKRITGKSLREYADEYIFKPLGMKHTFFNDEHKMIIKNRAVGYRAKEEGGFKINDTRSELVGDGGVFSTIDDLSLWAQIFYENKFGSENFISTLLTTGKLNNREGINYSFGLRMKSLGGFPIVTHGGSFFGFRADITWLLQHKMAFICLANLSSITPSNLIEQVVKLYLNDEYKEESSSSQKENEQFIKLHEEEFKNIIGKYLMQDYQVPCEILFENRQLIVIIGSQKFLIHPINKIHYRSVEGPFNISLIIKEKNITIETNSESYILEPIKPPTYTLEQLQEYSGVYYSEELDIVYSVTEEENQLKIKLREEVSPLIPAFKDVFVGKLNAVGASITIGARIAFIRDKQEKVTGFSLSSRRVISILFNKIIKKDEI
ncbi:MAG: serine hydrolase domain-containing protein [Candidatus Hermodarchaeota archaeon]